MATEKRMSPAEKKAADPRYDKSRIKTRELAPGIATHPFIRSGKPCIRGTGLKVTDIVVQQNHWQREPSEIAEHFDIEVSQVNDALSFYAAHSDYIDTDIRLQQMNHDQLEEAQYGVSPDSLISRRKPVS